MSDGRRRVACAPLAYGAALLVVALDQLSKWWVLGPLRLPELGRIVVVPHLFDFTLVHNSGVSFGLFHAGAELGRWLLTGFSLAVAVGLAWWARTAARPLVALAIGLVIGGAVGNAVDRVRLGEVTDFLDASGLHFPWVFNLADSAISVGVAVLLLDSLLAPKPVAGPASQPAAEKRP